jgi:hypothetical protein
VELSGNENAFSHSHPEGTTPLKPLEKLEPSPRRPSKKYARRITEALTVVNPETGHAIIEISIII